MTSNNTLKTGANKSNNKRSNQKLPQETSSDNLIDGARKSKREQVSSLNNRNLIKNSGIPRGSVDKDEHCNRNLHILGGSTDKKSVTNINRSKVNSGSKKIDAVKKTERASQKYLTKLELQSDIKNKELEVENNQDIPFRKNLFRSIANQLKNAQPDTVKQWDVIEEKVNDIE